MPIEIFCCYARKDQRLLKDLKVYLIPLQRQGHIIVWADTDINAGSEWEKEIEKHLETAQIILLLVSPDFIASEYCYSKEMMRAIERHEKEEAIVIPVILRPIYWQGTPFGNLQVLPKDAEPVTNWQNTDQAFFDVAEGIRKVVRTLLPTIQDAQSIYLQVTNRTPVLDDLLKSQNANRWTVGSWSNSSCLFVDGAYHVRIEKRLHYIAGFTQAREFSDFAFQVEMTLFTDAGGGLVFRTGSSEPYGYRCCMKRENRDVVDLVYGARGLIDNDTAFKIALNHPYLMTAIAYRNRILLYIDGECVGDVKDSSARSGKIGLLAYDFREEAHVVFRNAKAWDLTKWDEKTV